jgi:thioredoxin 2
VSVTYAPCPRCQSLNRLDLERAQSAAPTCGRCQTVLPVHGATVDADGAGLAKLISSSPLPVVADFWAEWCGPCTAFAPVFAHAAQSHAGRAVFVKVDTQAHPEAGSAHRVQAIPTFVAWRQGAERARQSGALPAPALDGWLGQVLG